MLKPYNRAELVFDLINEISNRAGRNSRTYVARDHQLDAEIVIKEIKKSRLASAPSFFEEAKALYASAHPNVVQIYYSVPGRRFGLYLYALPQAWIDRSDDAQREPDGPRNCSAWVQCAERLA